MSTATEFAWSKAKKGAVEVLLPEQGPLGKSCPRAEQQAQCDEKDDSPSWHHRHGEFLRVTPAVRALNVDELPVHQLLGDAAVEIVPQRLPRIPIRIAGPNKILGIGE